MSGATRPAHSRPDSRAAHLAQLTPEEQIDELTAMLREARIGIHEFDQLHSKIWPKVLEKNGQMSPTMAKKRYSDHRLSKAATAVNIGQVLPRQPPPKSAATLTCPLALPQYIERRSRASRKSKEMYREQVEAQVSLQRAAARGGEIETGAGSTGADA